MAGACPIFFDDKIRVHWPWIPDCRMNIGYRKSVHRAVPRLHVPLPIRPLGYTGRFVRSNLRRVPTVSTRRSA